MIFGDSHQFAIDCDIDPEDGTKGHIFFWIRGEPVGWQEHIILPANVIWFLRRSLSFSNDWRQDLCSYSDEVALDIVFTKLFVDNAREDEELQRDEKLFTPYLVSDYGSRAFDGWLVIRISCPTEERIIWRLKDREKGSSKTGGVHLPYGIYTAVVQSLLEWAATIPAVTIQMQS
jgi:hypothetical protein